MALQKTDRFPPGVPWRGLGSSALRVVISRVFAVQSLSFEHTLESGIAGGLE